MISFDPAAAAGMIPFAEDEFIAMLFGFSFEQLRDKLFRVIEINFPGNPDFLESPPESIDR